MMITAILCTYNRCDSLRKAMESLAASVVSAAISWEVLVVDNNSRDNTAEVVGEFTRNYPGRFRYLFEARQGKSHALNAAIASAQGDVLAFVDDDVIVDSRWLESICARVLAGDCIGTGGPVFPQDTDLPTWIKPDESYVRGPLVMFDLRSDPIELKEAPFGTNMAFAREAFLKYGVFRTDLGPQPGSEIRGEDSEFVNRLFAAGEKLRYEPTAVVHHEVPRCRMTKKYFLHWWFDKGRSEVRTIGVPRRDGWKLFGVPIVWFRRLVMWMLRTVTAPDPPKRMLAHTKSWYVAGQIVEAYRIHRKSSPSRSLAADARQQRILAGSK
jgi:glucosyl-dolichyl phosphate glucuronosyltransferase